MCQIAIDAADGRGYVLGVPTEEFYEQPLVLVGRTEPEPRTEAVAHTQPTSVLQGASELMAPPFLRRFPQQKAPTGGRAH